MRPSLILISFFLAVISAHAGGFTFRQATGRDPAAIHQAGNETAADIKTFTDTILISTGSGERMRITANGEIGIDTSTPIHRLTVQAGTLGGIISTDSDMFVRNSSYGLVLKDANGVCWRIGVVIVTGVLTTTSITCP